MPSAPQAFWPTLALTAGLLVLSNRFMTRARRGHLKQLIHRPWCVAALPSWEVAMSEYLLQVPANRIGYGTLTLRHLKILREAVALAAFAPFAVYVSGQPPKPECLWACLRVLGATRFVFRN